MNQISGSMKELTEILVKGENAGQQTITGSASQRAFANYKTRIEKAMGSLLAIRILMEETKEKMELQNVDFITLLYEQQSLKLDHININVQSTIVKLKKRIETFEKEFNYLNVIREKREKESKIEEW